MTPLYNIHYTFLIEIYNSPIQLLHTVCADLCWVVGGKKKRQYDIVYIMFFRQIDLVAHACVCLCVCLGVVPRANYFMYVCAMRLIYRWTSIRSYTIQISKIVIASRKNLHNYFVFNLSTFLRYIYPINPRLKCISNIIWSCFHVQLD